MIGAFRDGIKSLVNSLTNERNPQNTNAIVAGGRLTDNTKREVYRTGIGNKIVRIKSGKALKDTLQFETTADKDYYERRLAKQVKRATKFMIATGRGVIVMYMPGDDTSKPLNVNSINPERVKLKAFSDDLVSPLGVDLNLDSDRYYKPLAYSIRGVEFHHSRVIDFTYIEPMEMDAPNYRYGGISEFDLIYQELVSDGIINRAAVGIIDKASTFIYTIKGFKDSIRLKKEKELLEYFSTVESARNVLGAVVMDADDKAEAVNQQLTNLGETYDMSLRRLALVTGIPVSWLVGENVKGLNSTGDNERLIFQDMIEALQSDYILEPLNELTHKLGIGAVKFKENQGETPNSRVEFESKAIDNAVKLWSMGEDYGKYLTDKGVIEPDNFEEFFGKDDDDVQVNEEMMRELLGGQNGEASNS